MLSIRIGKTKSVYKQSAQTRRLLPPYQSKEAPFIGLRIRSKSKSTLTPIPMARNNNEITQIMNMLEKV